MLALMADYYDKTLVELAAINNDTFGSRATLGFVQLFSPKKKKKRKKDTGGYQPFIKSVSENTYGMYARKKLFRLDVNR